MQNGICEAFNGRMRDELLNETIFYDLDHARSTLARWTAAYNQKRPPLAPPQNSREPSTPNSANWLRSEFATAVR